MKAPSLHPDAQTPSPEDEALQSLLGEPSSTQTLTPPLPQEWGLLSEESAAVLMHPSQQIPTDETTPQNPTATLQRWWGFSEFRGIQRDIIDSILAGNDTVGLMPTGGGKSIAFQVPALMLEGTCIVVTPLIALMRDQVENLRARGIRATAIHAGLSSAEINRELDNCILGNYKFLYLSPERLHTELFRFKLSYLRVSFVAIDEAHCISQWGYDFRPAYLRLQSLRQLLPTTPILALTATATAIVLEDIQRQLAMRNQRVFRMSFERKNIAYIVQHSENKFTDLVKLIRGCEGSIIVYHRSRGGTRDTALALQQQGIDALYYHAGLPTTDKNFRQQAWQNNDVRVMVATNAFGMGIDKPDVRLVVHLDLPDSIEAYFQEAGRAGRDGNFARAVLLFNRHDQRNLAMRVGQTFPEKQLVRDIYADLACYHQIGVGMGEGMRREFNLEDFSRNFKRFPLTVVSAITILQRAGYLDFCDEHDTQSRVTMIVRREELYAFRARKPENDDVLMALLRAYEGLFSDYVAIDEARLANACNCTEDDVYHALKALTRARILHYIPRKRVATIEYLVPREAPERLALGEEVYERRREQYERRINGMLNYCSDQSTCRSVQLLRYFDDHTPHRCGHCDVCGTFRTDSDESLRRHLRQILADGKPHLASDFDTATSDHDDFRRIVDELLESGEISFDGLHFVRVASA